jgi:replicative DNA helicase
MLTAAARANNPAVYIGLEMGEVQLAARLLGQSSGQSWSDLYYGRGNIDKAEQHVSALDELPLYFEPGRPMGFTAQHITEAIEGVRDNHPRGAPGSNPMIVALDFLQLVGSDDPRDSLRERIGKAAYIATYIAKHNDAAVILVSSTARNNYDELATAPPSDVNKLIGVGKESGEIEYAADGLLVMCSNAGKQYLVLPKVRAGASRCFELTADPAIGAFSISQHFSENTTAVQKGSGMYLREHGPRP